MSNPSNNNRRFNSSRNWSFYDNPNIDRNITKDTLLMKDFSSLVPPSGLLIGELK